MKLKGLKRPDTILNLQHNFNFFSTFSHILADSSLSFSLDADLSSSRLPIIKLPFSQPKSKNCRLSLCLIRQKVPVVWRLQSAFGRFFAADDANNFYTTVNRNATRQLFSDCESKAHFADWKCPRKSDHFPKTRERRAILSSSGGRVEVRKWQIWRKFV